MKQARAGGVHLVSREKGVVGTGGRNIGRQRRNLMQLPLDKDAHMDRWMDTMLETGDDIGGGLGVNYKLSKCLFKLEI
jgi:hypothetical protein